MQLARSAASPCGTAMLSERDLHLRTHHDSKGDKQTLRAGAADLRPTTLRRVRNLTPCNLPLTSPSLAPALAPGPWSLAT